MSLVQHPIPDRRPVLLDRARPASPRTRSSTRTPRARCASPDGSSTAPGDPISDGLIEIWSATARAWGRCGTADDGSFWFVLAKPPAGPGEAPRYDVFVFARGLLRHQLTRLYFPDEPDANAADPVLGGLSEADRATLVAEQADGGLRFDIRMQGDRQTVFFEH